MTQREYAQRRGVSQTAVSRAVSSGRLKSCLDDRGRIADPELADREWDATTDLTRAPPYVRERAEQRAPAESPPARAPPPVHRLPISPAQGEVLSLADASALEKTWKARLAEMKYREAAGELVRAADVRGKLEGMIHACRTKLLGVPSRARQQDPTMTVPQLEMVEALIREALEELAAGGGL